MAKAPAEDISYKITLYSNRVNLKKLGGGIQLLPPFFYTLVAMAPVLPRVPCGSKTIDVTSTFSFSGDGFADTRVYVITTIHADMKEYSILGQFSRVCVCGWCVCVFVWCVCFFGVYVLVCVCVCMCICV